MTTATRALSAAAPPFVPHATAVYVKPSWKRDVERVTSRILKKPSELPRYPSLKELNALGAFPFQVFRAVTHREKRFTQMFAVIEVLGPNKFPSLERLIRHLHTFNFVHSWLCDDYSTFDLTLFKIAARLKRELEKPSLNPAVVQTLKAKLLKFIHDPEGCSDLFKENARMLRHLEQVSVAIVMHQMFEKHPIPHGCRPICALPDLCDGSMICVDLLKEAAVLPLHFDFYRGLKWMLMYYQCFLCTLMANASQLFKLLDNFP